MRRASSTGGLVGLAKSALPPTPLRETVNSPSSKQFIKVSLHPSHLYTHSTKLNRDHAPGSVDEDRAANALQFWKARLVLSVYQRAYAEFGLTGSSGYPRFPKLSFAIPDRVLLAWPSFHIDGVWVSASELFGTITSLAQVRPLGFTNDGGTLFDALQTTAVDWDGTTNSDPVCSQCDLSSRVVIDLGYFDSRDDLFKANGQTLCAPARIIAAPFFARRIVS